ncbi:MAG: alpha/beta hydrolase [Pseudomonadota bacterium]
MGAPPVAGDQGSSGPPVPPPVLVQPQAGGAVSVPPPLPTRGIEAPAAVKVDGPPRYLPSVYVADDPDSPCSQTNQAPLADEVGGYTCIDLLFATNRAHPWVEPFSDYAYPANPARFFRDRPLYDTGVRGALYSTGRISVTVPKRLPGDPIQRFKHEERFLVFFSRHNTASDEDRAKFFTTSDYEILPSDDFWQLAAEKLSLGDAVSSLPTSWQTDAGTVLVFVHGFRESLESAAFRTAQLTYDLEFAGVPLFFSWPATSETGLLSNLRYFNDVSDGVASVGDLKQFLLDVDQRLDPKRYVVVAHSHGNQVLLRALNEIAAETPGGAPLFDAVIFASPDVDAYEFQRTMTRAAPLAGSKTLYAADVDKALGFRELMLELGGSISDEIKYMAGTLRPGSEAPEPVIVPGVDSIDVSDAVIGHLGGLSHLENVKDRFSHSIYGDSCDIIRDIRSILDDPTARPDQRLPGLAPVPASAMDGEVFWRFIPPTGGSEEDWCANRPTPAPAG